jgi:hypothetical protein
MADKGGGFAQPHIQYVRLNTADLKLIEQRQIWNPDIAFNFASFAISWDRVGAVLGFGGAADYGTPAVGIMGDGVFYAPCISAANADRFGDYLTVRQAWPNSRLFSAFVYCVTAGPTFNPRYVLFGRSADRNVIPIARLFPQKGPSRTE